MTLITLRVGNSGQWSESNRVLRSGEPGYNVSNKLLKIGDGASNWINLPYYGSGLFSEVSHSHTTNNITDFNSSVSGLLPNIIGSGYLVSNFSANSYTLAITGLQPSGNYANATHSHNISDINNFNSEFSGLLPVKNILASTGIFVSGVDGNYTIAVTGNFGLTGSQVDSRVSGYIQAGSGIVFNYSNNNLTINSIATGNTISSSGTGPIDITDLENVVDGYFDTFLTAGTGINFSYNNNILTVNSNLVSPPPSSSASGNIGQFSYDNEYFYVCINDNLWKRTSLNSW